MNRRKGKMAELVEQRGNKYVDAILFTMLRYYTMLDMDTGTNHAQVFENLYFNDDKKTYEQVALECHIYINTVKRYVKKYDKLLEKLLNNKDLFTID